MGLNNTNTDAISFKKLKGKAHTQQNFALSEESIGTNVQASYSTIFSNKIEKLPVTNSGLTTLYSSNNIVERIKFQVDIIPDTEISSGRSQGYKLKLPSDYSSHPGKLYPEFGSGTYLYNGLGRLQIVPSFFGQVKGDGSTEYDPILYQTNGSTVISKYDPINWILDTYNGILFVQDPPAGFDVSAARPGYVEAYLYVGDYVDDLLMVVSSGTTGTTASNVGIGTGVFKQKVGQDLRFKSIYGRNGVSVSGNTDNVVISFTGVTGGGVGTITGATNGLSLSGGGRKTKLGGNLTGSTTIGLGTSNLTFTGTTGTLRYGSDLSAQYNVRSIVDKGYVTGLTNSLSSIYQTKTSINTLTGTTLPATYQTRAGFNTYTGTTAPNLYISGATNGLSKQGRRVRLGGNLTGSTTIGLGTNNLTFTGTTGTLRYGSNLSSQYNVRSLVDKGYVTGLTSSILNIVTGNTSYVTGATNGISKTGRKIKLGGALTGNTTITTSTNVLTITGNTYLSSFTGNTRTLFNNDVALLTDKIIENSNDFTPSTKKYVGGFSALTNYTLVNTNFSVPSTNTIVSYLANNNGFTSSSDWIVYNNSLLQIDSNGSFLTGYNRNSNNYNGTLFPSSPTYLNAVMLDDVMYISKGGVSSSGFLKFDTTTLTLTEFTYNSANYNGDLFVTGSTGRITAYPDNIFITNTNGGLFRYEVSTNTVFRYSSPQIGYTGSVISGSCFATSILNDKIYIATTNVGFYEFDLNTLVAKKMSTTSGNYGGTPLNSNVLRYVVNDGIYVYLSYGSGSGFYRYDPISNTGTSYTNISTNYTGSKFPASQFGSLFYDQIDNVLVYSPQLPTSNSRTGILNLTTYQNKTFDNILGINEGGHRFNIIGRDNSAILGTSYLGGSSSGGIGLFQFKVGNSPFNLKFNQFGERYSGNYRNYFSDTSLVDKGYVDNYLNFTDGLIKTSNIVRLGGTVDNDTTLTLGNDRYFAIVGNNNEGTTSITITNPFESGSTINLGVGDAFFSESYSNLTLQKDNVYLGYYNQSLSGHSGTLNLGVPNSLFKGYVELMSTNNSTGNIVSLQMSGGTDMKVRAANNINFKGLQYDGNYSANFRKYSLVDKNYVTGLTATLTGTSSLATNGLTKILNTVVLGGTLTGNTTIATGTGNRLRISGWPIEYTSNISSNFGSRSLVDKGYVTGLTSGFTQSSYSAKVTITGATTLNGSNLVVLCNTNAAVAGFTVSLQALPSNGKIIKIKDTGNAFNKNITISGNGKNIDGSPTAVINTNYGGVELCYDTALNMWFIMNFVG